MLKKILLISISFIVVSCSGVNNKDPNSVADNFVKHYYKFMNTEESQKYTDMMAKDKIAKEIVLLRESRSRNPDMAINRPQVSYKLSDSKIEKDMGFLTYNLTIIPKESKSFDKTALITLKNENSEWKVIDFTETSPVN